MQILCALAFDAGGGGRRAARAPSLNGLSRRVRLDTKTVRNRIRRLERSGFIKYYQSTPHPALLGAPYLAIVRFEAMNIATKLAAVDQARQEPGVLDVVDYLGPTFSVSSAAASAEESELLSARIARQFELAQVRIQGETSRPPERTPTSLDWRILGRLRYDGHASLEAIAAGLRITPRMARYRVQQLLDSGAIVIRPILDPTVQNVPVLYQLTATIAPGMGGEVAHRLRRSLGDRTWSVHAPTDGPVRMELFGFSLADPEADLVRVLHDPAVRSVVSLITKEHLEPRRPSWVDRGISDRAEMGRSPERHLRRS